MNGKANEKEAVFTLKTTSSRVSIKSLTVSTFTLLPCMKPLAILAV